LEHRKLNFRRLSGSFAVWRLPADSAVPAWASSGDDFSSITRTKDELSIVCPFHNVPAECHPKHQWACFKLEGPFPFSAVGILSSFVTPLAKAKIPIFALSTFDTDYVLVRQEDADSAVEALKRAGHELISIC
jgi:hypothetical protein